MRTTSWFSSRERIKKNDRRMSVIFLGRTLCTKLEPFINHKHKVHLLDLSGLIPQMLQNLVIY